MLIGNVRPKTLNGVKRLATQLCKQQGIKRSVALDLAAQMANCSNFRNARNVLHVRPAQEEAPLRRYVMLTNYWLDKGHYRRGRETLTIEMSKFILDICGKYSLKIVRGFVGFRMVADDHFVSDILSPTQDDARQRLCTAERSLRFMEHTGLLPSREYRKARLKGSSNDNLPNEDHPTHWFDPASKQFILIDEPYSDAADETKRAAWAVRNGWHIVKTSWPGMYYPHYCDLYVATDGRAGYDLGALVAKIDGMPAPLLEKDWPGESSSSWKKFLSPMAKTAQDMRRAQCRGTIYPTAGANSVPYSYQFGSFQRRPAGKMEIKEHIEAGRIIKAVLSSDRLVSGIHRRLNSLRSTLEDWMSLEIGHGELEGPEFFDIYYHKSEKNEFFEDMVKSHAGIVSILGCLKQKLQAAYPDCAPLRQQLKRIDMSVSLIRAAG